MEYERCDREIENYHLGKIPKEQVICYTKKELAEKCKGCKSDFKLVCRHDEPTGKIIVYYLNDTRLGISETEVEIFDDMGVLIMDEQFVYGRHKIDLRKLLSEGVLSIETEESDFDLALDNYKNYIETHYIYLSKEKAVEKAKSLAPNILVKDILQVIKKYSRAIEDIEQLLE